jgi:hypothetical protein
MHNVDIKALKAEIASKIPDAVDGKIMLILHEVEAKCIIECLETSLTWMEDDL